jgi:SAM-dependent methyltransferase
MDTRHINRVTWDKQVEARNPWTVPVGPEVIAKARAGEWAIFLTPTRPVPSAWLGSVEGRRILCLASGGGQQGPVLAAAGAVVTVFDNSPRQLEQDRMVAKREGLAVETVEGTMNDLSAFPDSSFHLVVHPVSNCFVQDVRAVWTEAARVLRAGGAILSGFNNPMVYAFDTEAMESAETLQVKHGLPYSDLETLDEEGMQERLRRGIPVEFSHTLQTLIGGQLDAVLVITGFYEDHDRLGENAAINRYFSPYIATRAVKPGGAEGVLR